jgi:hypothetical protein
MPQRSVLTSPTDSPSGAFRGGGTSIVGLGRGGAGVSTGCEGDALGGVVVFGGDVGAALSGGGAWQPAIPRTPATRNAAVAGQRRRVVIGTPYTGGGPPASRRASLVLRRVRGTRVGS